MKKNALYILLAVMIGAAITVFLTNNQSKKRRKLDERLSMHRRDKIPYGLHVAYNSLATMFPNARITTNKNEPGLWEDIRADESNQALIIITQQFNADEYELKQLVSFVENGNDVFISTRQLSSVAQTFFQSFANSPDTYLPFSLVPDSLRIHLDSGSFTGPLHYTFPGKQYAGYFTSVHEESVRINGTNDEKNPDFIRLRAGTGNLYVHLAPIAFTNYFLVHKSNISYYEQVMSLIPATTRKVVWDEYYRYKTTDKDTKKNWLSVLMNMQNSEGKKPFRAALLVVLALLLIYVLIEMRRKQRFIPIIRKPGNASLDFTRTIGRLYHDKGDHNNLARKMTAYFLEHVRNRYKLVTSDLSETFIKQLHFKTGVDEVLITDIVHSIHKLEHSLITDRQLATFHKQLETFYKTA